MSSSHDQDSDMTFEGLQEGMGFAVTVLTDCPHIPTDTSAVKVGVDVPCQECDDAAENWQCLHCGAILCSRYRHGHMKKHCEATDHAVCLSYSDLSIWCFKCSHYVAHESLDDIKFEAYRAKFNRDPPSIASASSSSGQQ
ncbi:hypothetical protein BC940DRAFT_311076 [Gongronella butleri]|nr:hypothetical protein BC940DRAFT_311076 [Gongronella butleri]